MIRDLRTLFGLLMPNAAGQRDAPAEPSPPMQIPGAHTARELCMLATDANLPAGRELEIVREHGKPGKNVVQLKADGIRALYIDGRIVSREGAPLDCALHCQPGLARIEKAAGLGPLVFDGEYVANEGFNATLAEHKRGIGEGTFWAFDVMPLVDWQSGACHSVPVQDRVALLRKMIVEHGDSLFVGALDAWHLDPVETIAKAREIWAAGGEGVVVKRWNSSYIRARSDAWLRVKQTFTVDARIVDLVATAEGTLKTLIVRAVDGSIDKPVRIGTGWTVDEGRQLVRDFNGGRDHWAEISFQLSTGATRSFRGARFHRLRLPKGK